MGIKGLIPLLIKNVGKKAIKNYPITKFSGLSVAIDASLLIYQIVLGIRNRGDDMKNEDGEITSHLYGLFLKINNLLSYKITPIFVFDGISPEEKKKTIDKRNERRTDAKNKFDGTEDENEKNKMNQRTFEITDDIYNSTIELLQLMGIPFIESPGEADIVCAWLSINRYVKGVASEDSDILAFGSRYLFRNLTKTGTDCVTVINLEKTLKALNYSLSDFQTLSVLLGCDYCDNIPRIGPSKAFNLVNTHNSLDEIITTLENKNIEFDKDCIKKAKIYFNKSVSELEKSGFKINNKRDLKLKKCLEIELTDYLHNRKGFSMNLLQKRINDLCTYQSNFHLESNNYKYKRTNASIPLIPRLIKLSFDQS